MTEPQRNLQPERLAALYSRSAALDATLAPAQLYERVLNASIRLTGAGSGILLRVGDDGELETVAAHNWQQEPANSGELQLSRSMVARVIASGEAVQDDDGREDERAAGEQSAAGQGRLSQLCAPLEAHGQITGAVLVAKPLANGAFLPGDLDLLTAFASLAAMALANARRFQQIDQSLARLKQQARAADEARSDFISLVTHELRIPMTSIRGYTDLLLGEIAGPLSEPQKEFAATIRRNVERMTELVQSLSDLNRLESGRMKFEPEIFDLNEILEEVAYDFREATASRQQTVTLAPSPLPLLVHADRIRIGEALANLVNNANKYTPEGGTICLRAGSEGAMAAIAITDDGIGISPQDQERLFTDFFRSEDEIVRAQAGWGLGLAIARRLVEAHGGRLSCHSMLREGSTFTLSLPLARGVSDDR